MDRRTFLAATAIPGAVASIGCTGSSLRDDRQRSSGGSTGSSPATVDDSRTIDARTIKLQTSLAVASDVTVVRNQSLAEPAQLHLVLRNEGDEPVEIAVGPTPPFSAYLGEHVEQADSAFLVPHTDDQLAFTSGGQESDTAPSDPVRGCWQLDDVRWTTDIGTVTIEPNDSLDGVYSLYATRLNQDCLTPGTYRFEDTQVFEEGGWGINVTVDG